MRCCQHLARPGERECGCGSAALGIRRRCDHLAPPGEVERLGGPRRWDWGPRLGDDAALRAPRANARSTLGRRLVAGWLFVGNRQIGGVEAAGVAPGLRAALRAGELEPFQRGEDLVESRGVAAPADAAESARHGY